MQRFLLAVMAATVFLTATGSAFAGSGCCGAPGDKSATTTSGAAASSQGAATKDGAACDVSKKDKGASKASSYKPPVWR